MTERRIHAVLFDLDDTLLYDDMEGTFLAHYFAALTEYARPLAEPERLMAAYGGHVHRIGMSDEMLLADSCCGGDEPSQISHARS